MVKREYRGPPIDAREQFITERPGMSGTPTRDDDDGETVAGSTEDDLFSESTDNIPTYLDRESTPNQILNVIGWAVSVSYRYAVNQQQDFNAREVRQILEDYLREEDFERIKGIEAAPTIELEDLPPKQQEAAEAFKSHSDFPDVSPDELADANSFSKNTARRAIHTMYPGLRGFDDLNESTKVAIQVWAFEGLDASQTALNEKWDIPMRPLGDAKRVYPDLVEAQQPIEESTVEAAVERYQQDHARPKSESSSQSPGGQQVSQKAREEREYPDDFTELQEWFIESIAAEPWLSASELGERTEWSSNNYHRIVKEYPETVKRRIEQKAEVESTDEMNDYILENTAHLDEWNLDVSEGVAELEQEIDVEEVAEIEAEPEAEIETEPEFDSNATERFGFDIEEEVVAELDLSRYSSTRVLLRPELVEGVKDRLVEADEYKSMTELVNSAVKKELNGGFEPASETTVEADVIETVIESLYGERKANAIRTLLADE